MDEETRGILRLISDKLDQVSQALARIEQQTSELSEIAEEIDERRDDPAS
jgi:hypothetical protein